MPKQSQPSAYRLPKDCTVERIAEIHKDLLKRFNTAGDVLVDISQVARTDVTFIQLALALELAGKNEGKAVSWQGGPSESIARALRLTGHRKTPLLQGLTAAAGEE